MRRPVVLLAATALALPLLAPLTPSTAARTDAREGDAGTRVRHFLSENRFTTRRDDAVHAVAASGDVVAFAGESYGPSKIDSFVRALTLDLTPLWTVRLEDNLTVAEAVGTDGEVVAAGGSTYDDLDPSDAAVGYAWLQVYDGQGTPLWTRQVGSDDGDAILTLELTAQAVYAAGRVAGVGTVWKYDHQGGLLWKRELAHTTPNAVTDLVLLQDQVVVTEDRPFDDHSRLVALDEATGAVGWSTTPLAQTPPILTTDDTSIFAAGIDLEDGYADLSSFDSDGDQRWSRGIYTADDLPEETYTSAYGLAWDGNAVVVVSEIANGGDELIAFDTDGNRGWRVPAPSWYEARSAVKGPAGFYVGGTAEHPRRPTDWEGIVSRYVLYQPDVRARFLHGDDLLGDDRYSPRRQRLVVTVEGVKPRSVVISGQNDGEVGQRLRVNGCEGHAGYGLRYLDSTGANVTAAVTGPGYRTRALTPGAFHSLRVVITPRRRTTGPATCTVSVASPTAGERDRLVLAITRR